MKKKKINRDKKGRVVKGSRLALKYDTKEKQLELIERYCQHISEGYSIESFEEVDYRTINEYAEKLDRESAKTDDFTILSTVRIQKAIRSSRLKWEKWGIQGMLNEIPSFNAQIWALNMRNRFNWDKDDKSPKEMTIDRIITVNFVKDEK